MAVLDPDDKSSDPLSEIRLKVPPIVADKLASEIGENPFESGTADSLVLSSSKRGFRVIWLWSGMKSHWSESRIGLGHAKHGFSIRIDPSSTTQSGNALHSDARLAVTDLASGTQYIVIAHCDIDITYSSPGIVKAVAATVAWQEPQVLLSR